MRFREILEGIKSEGVEQYGEKIAPTIREAVSEDGVIELLDGALRHLEERAGIRAREAIEYLKNFSAGGVAFHLVYSLLKHDGELRATEPLVEFTTMYVLHTLLEEYRAILKLSMNPRELPIVASYTRVLKMLIEKNPEAVARGIARFVNSIRVEAESKRLDALIEMRTGSLEIKMPLYLREWLYEVTREMGRTPEDFIIEILHRYYDIWKIGRDSKMSESDQIE
jgi:hypothetical protein